MNKLPAKAVSLQVFYEKLVVAGEIFNTAQAEMRPVKTRQFLTIIN